MIRNRSIVSGCNAGLWLVCSLWDYSAATIHSYFKAITFSHIRFDQLRSPDKMSRSTSFESWKNLVFELRYIEFIILKNPTRISEMSGPLVDRQTFVELFNKSKVGINLFSKRRYCFSDISVTSMFWVCFIYCFLSGVKTSESTIMCASNLAPYCRMARPTDLFNELWSLRRPQLLSFDRLDTTPRFMVLNLVLYYLLENGPK